MPDEDVGCRVHGLDRTGADDAVQRTADDPHEPFHDAQVIQHRHQCGEEDDDRQNVDGEAEAHYVNVGERSEHHVDARPGIVDDGEYATAEPVDGAASPVEIQHERGDRRLQRESGTDDPQVDRFPVTREREGNRQQHDDAHDADQVAPHATPGAVVMAAKDTLNGAASRQESRGSPVALRARLRSSGRHREGSPLHDWHPSRSPREPPQADGRRPATHQWAQCR